MEIVKLGMGQYAMPLKAGWLDETLAVFGPSGACVGRIAARHVRFRIVNTWNGGEGGRKVVFESKRAGVDGHNECFKWIHDHTSHSFDSAVRDQGYDIEPFQ